VLMEDVMRKVGIITEILRVTQGGKYVFTKCLFNFLTFVYVYKF